MKQIIAILLGIFVGCSAFAQLPKWVITPDNDSLSVKVDGTLLQTDSLGTTALWTPDGKCLYRTTNYVQPFNEGVAVITKKGTNELVGVVNLLGEFTRMPNVQVAYDHPYFEDGHLICSDSNGYTYFKKDGSKVKLTPSLRSYPFNGGYAPYFTYEQLEKRKDPYYGYYRADGENMKYRMLDKGEEKEFEPKEISFLSGIGENDKGVAVIKDKLYLFNTQTGLFEPFLYGDEESEKKRHLTLIGDYEKYFLNLPADSIQVVAKYGNKQIAVLLFDKELRPLSFTFDNEKQEFVKPAKEKYKYSSDIKSYGEGGIYGISNAEKLILPQQFEEVGLLYDNKAFVKSKGKWGVIEIIPGVDYSLKLNKGEDVAFRHHTFETQIRLDLPSQISAKDARIDIPASSGCVIDKTSRETKDTESGNFVVYNCSLKIPENLPDTSTNITYSPVSISYDGISLFERPIDIKAWHRKYHNVDPIESETSITNGVASFTININVEKNGGESDYPFDLRIEADSVAVEYEKISETRYKCLVSNLQEGDNDLNIIVTEKGCPPSVFPFEINYTKPVPKKKTKEAVVVRKKSTQAPKPAVRKEKPPVRKEKAPVRIDL